MAYYPEEDVLTPRDSHAQRAIRSGYTGPKNTHGEPDTTGTDEIGVMIYPPNEHYVRYSGQWKNGNFEGHGTVIFGSDNKDHAYTGGFKNGELHGRGVYTFPDGQVLDGEFNHDKIVRGTHISSGWTFQGAFVNGKMHKGRLIEDDGTEFEGTFETPTKRFGVFRYNGDVLSGTFDLDGGWELNGYGEMIVNSMPVKFTYKGQFRNGVRHGKGTMNINGITYSAEFNDDVEIKGTKRIIIPKRMNSESKKSGGARYERTRCRRKRLRSSKRR
jgi:hypothetical protein